MIHLFFNGHNKFRAIKSPHFFLLKKMFLLLSLVLAQRTIVFDGGSTGTRCFLIEYTNVSNVYSFHQYEENGQVFYYSINEPLQDMDTSSDASIKRIMDVLLETGMNTVIPPAERPQISLLVYSTAGMRNEPESRQNEINDYIYNYLSRTYTYSVQRSDVRTLPGWEEAMFQWLAVNQIFKAIGSNFTVAVVSLGGESIQFTLEMREAPDDSFLDPFIYDIQVMGRHHYTFLYSWLNLGTNTVAGYSHRSKYDAGDLTTPCGYKGSTNFAIGIDDDWIDFSGTGNFTECYNLYSTLYDKPNPDSCHGYPGIFSDYQQDNCIPLVGDFEWLYGMSEAQSAVKYARPHFTQEYITTGQLKANAINAANTYTQEEMITFNEGDENAMWTLSNQALMLQFLERGFSAMSPNISQAKYVTSEQYKGQWVNWEIGAAIAKYSTGFQIVQPEDSSLSPGAIAGIAVGCVAFVAIVIVVIVVIIMKKRKSYQNASSGKKEDV